MNKKMNKESPELSGDFVITMERADRFGEFTRRDIF